MKLPGKVSAFGSEKFQTTPDDITKIIIMSSESKNAEYWNFVKMAVLFSANHGCVVACLSLATARLGNVGAWQSGILYVHT